MSIFTVAYEEKKHICFATLNQVNFNEFSLVIQQIEAIMFEY